MSNLLPEQAKKSIRAHYRARLAITILFLVGWVLLAWVIFLVPSYISIKDRKGLIEQKLDVITRQNADNAATPLKDTVASINAKLHLFAKEPVRPISQAILEPALSGKPDGILLSQVEIARKSATEFHVTMVGQAKNREVLQGYTKVLEAVSEFSKVSVPLPHYLKGSQLEFTIEFDVKL